MKKKIFKFLCSYSEINDIFKETMYKKFFSKYITRIIKIPFMIKIICINGGKRKKRFYEMMEQGGVFDIKKYNSSVSMYLPYISYKNGIIEGDLIQKVIFLTEDFYEAKELHYIKDKYLKNVVNMLDIGANIGNHTVFYSKIAGFKKIYSFEPIKETYEILAKNVLINNLSGVVTYNIGLGEKEAIADVHLRKDDNCGATQLEYNDNGNIKILAIDQLEIVDKIDFIKIDVEGFEVGVLKGAKELIKRDSPIVFVETFPENYESVVELMNSYNYYIEENIGHDNYLFMKKK